MEDTTKNEMIWTDGKFSVWKIYLQVNLHHSEERYGVISRDTNEYICKSVEEAQVFISNWYFIHNNVNHK